MKFKPDLKKISSFKFNSLATHISVVLWVFMGLMVLLVGWIVTSELRKVKVLTPDATTAQNQAVRVNTEKYKQLEERLDANKHFQPQQIPNAEVFTAPGS